MNYSWRARPKAQAPTQEAPQASQQESYPSSPQPSKAPDMSAYAQPSGGYNAYNVPRSAPKGAQSNDLSGNVPSNQVWGQAYSQAAGQYGLPGATSWTNPGSYSSQGYNPTTGQYSQPTGGQSFDGNMAYNAIDNRPSPVSAYTPGLDGTPMSIQDSLMQRDAFVGNLSQRLGQYNSGAATGPVTFDPVQLMSQANDQLSNGAFYNPFSQQNPEVQQAMGNASQYAQGNFQNPFGDSPEANNPQASWLPSGYNRYNQTVRYQRPAPEPTQPGAAQPIQPPSLGTSYDPSPTELPEPPAQKKAAPVRYGWRYRSTPKSAPVTKEAPPEAPAPPAKKAPQIRAPQNMVIVPPNRRGSAARFGSMRQNGDNRR